MLLNRKKLYAGVLFFLSLLIISGFILFEYSVRWAEKSIEIMVSDLRKRGFTVSYSSVEVKGNPLFLKIIFQNPHIKDPKGLLEWEGQEVDIVMNPWQFYTLTCTFPGDHKIFLPQNTPIPLGFLQLEGAKGIITLSSQGFLEEAVLTTERILSFLNTQPQPVFLQDLLIKVENLVDLSHLKMSFATYIINLESTLNIKPFDHPLAFTFEANLSGDQSKNSFPKSLAEWRDRGGIVEVRSLKLIWPPINIEAEGTLTLDKSMYPLGSFSSRVVGYQNVLSYMIELGWVKKKKAAAALFIFDLFSVPDATGTKRLTIPITLQNKTLSIGPAPLLKLRPLEDI